MVTVKVMAVVTHMAQVEEQVELQVLQLEEEEM
jgi:hypothetical protein